MFNRILPTSVIVAKATLEMWHTPCLPEEMLLVKNAVKKRQKEFQAGRHCAREALAQLGIHHFPVLSGNKREPLWPKGIIGSITHCHNYCAVAVCSSQTFKGIGIDVEKKTPLEKSVLDLICTESEQTWLKKNNLTETFWSKIFFSAKECLYKSYYPITHQYLDFLEAEFSFNIEDGTFSVELLKNPPNSFTINQAIRGRFAFDQDYIFTALIIQ